MGRPKDWIVASGVFLVVVFGGRGAATGQDIPDGIKALALAIIVAGMAADPINAGVAKLFNVKPEDK